MNILQALNQRPIAYYPIYRQITGSTTAGILLSQLMYWFSKKDKFYKTDADIMTETLLTKKELENAKKKIKNLSFVKVTREGIPAKTYYEIDWHLYEMEFDKIATKEYKPNKMEVKDTSNKENYNPKKVEHIYPKKGNTDTTKSGNYYTPKRENPIPRKGETITKTTTKTTTKNKKINKKTFLELLKSSLLNSFKQNKLLSLKEKINISKVDKDIKDNLYSLEDINLNDIVEAYTSYVKEYRNYSKRLNLFLLGLLIDKDEEFTKYLPKQINIDNLIPLELIDKNLIDKLKSKGLNIREIQEYVTLYNRIRNKEYILQEQKEYYENLHSRVKGDE